jgi:hypothetical protein
MNGRIQRLLLAAFGAAVSLACGETGAGEEDTAATFSRVTTEVITTKNCGGPLCHSTIAGGFTLGAKDALHATLVGPKAAGPKCGPSAVDGGAGWLRVVPGDPEGSLLYQKLSYAPPCGDGMPVAGPLDDAKVDLVRRWIEAGAKND